MSKIEDYSIGQKIARLVTRYSNVEGSIKNGKASVNYKLDIARLIDEALFNEVTEHSESENCKKQEVELLDRNTSSGSI